MEPEKFRTLSELAEEDVVVGTQKRQSLAFEAKDTLRSVYSSGVDDDGSSVYFSVTGSRASSMMMDGSGTIKSASFSEVLVSDESRHDGCSEEEEDIVGRLEQYGNRFNLQGDDVPNLFSLEREKEEKEKETEKKEEKEEEVEVAEEERKERETMQPAAGSFGKDAGMLHCESSWHKEEGQDDVVPKEKTTIHRDEDGESFMMRSRALLSEAESIGPMMFSDNNTTTERAELHLPTPIHEEKSCEMSPERRKDASPCKLCLEREQHIRVLEESVQQMREDMAQAHSDLAKYKKQISDMQQEQTSSLDDQLERLQEEIRYLQVIHTEEISVLSTENGILRQQLQDCYQDSRGYNSYNKFEYNKTQTRLPAARKPKKITIPPEEPRHSDSPDQIGYSPLAAARIQFK